MGDKDQALADADLNWLKGVSRAAAETSLWLAAVVTLGTAVTPGTEVTGGGYERLEITTGTDWSAIAHSADNEFSYITNAVDFAFIEPTADWGEIVGWELYDDPTAGSRLYFSELNPHQYIETGVVLKILAGELMITEA